MMALKSWPIATGVNKPKESNPNGDEPLERLQSLLVEPQILELRQRYQVLDRKLAHFEQQLAILNYQVKLSRSASQGPDPKVLTELVRPIIVEMLHVYTAETQEALSGSITDLIDVALTTKIQQDRTAVTIALAPIIPDSIAYSSETAPEAMGRAIAPNLSLALKEHIERDRGSIAEAIAPEMGAALKEQIRLERDAVVDALYPVIGNTISRYFAELLNDINDKLEQTLSFETVIRKFKAKLQGVSEAELLLRDATPVYVQAVFLIHKPSGLVIAEAQPTDRSPLESTLIAGMLTAIRSFVSEYVSQPERASELREIEYGDAQIWLEEAGYCYLAVVVQGGPSKGFLNGIKGILAQLVSDHSGAIQRYDGDSSRVPKAIEQRLQQLIANAAQTSGRTRSSVHSPRLLLALVRWVMLGLVVGSVVWGYRHHQHHQLLTRLNQRLQDDPALALYRLEVYRDRRQLVLKGYVPTATLAQRAATLILSASPPLTLRNQVIVVQPPTIPNAESGNPIQ